MRAHHGRAVVWFVAAAALLGFVSCGDSSPAPTPIPRPNPGSSTSTIVNLELGVPESLAPGTRAQLTLRAVRSDGSSENLTSGVQWSSSDTRTLPVDAQGVVTAVTAGEARITARHDGRSASNTILVLPAGTYRLSGKITDEDQPISGASVVVIAGSGQGLTSITNSSGAYSLYGVAGSIKLHVKRTDYQNLIQDIHVSENTTHDMVMALATPRDPLSGQYRLTLTANGCSNIPSELRQRTYDATVEHRGSSLTITLAGADFIVSNGKGNHFTGNYNADDRIVFTLGDRSFYYYYYYYFNALPDLVERVSETSALIIHGSVIATHDGTGIIAGSMAGSFNVTNRLTDSYWPYAASCFDSRHWFELRRR